MNKTNLHQAAKEIFNSALHAVDAREAVRSAATLDKSLLKIRDTEVDVSCRPIYVVAIGKAGAGMAAGLSDVLGSKLTRGIVCSLSSAGLPALDANRWQVFAGGHPMPTAESLAAARASLSLLKSVEDDALVIFLISGGGSAMFELPFDEQITIPDLREANRQLVSCGASIAEINAVRRAFSAVKGGKLARSAPRTNQITLIVSDTNSGDEASVASGPTLDPTADAPNAADIVKRYGLGASLPPSILNAINGAEDEEATQGDRIRAHYVLLDNQTALEAAAMKANQLGFTVEIAADINEQEVDAGSELLLSRVRVLWEKAGGNGKGVCLLSGGEFSCPVRGDGLGGRNAETVLRCAMKLSKAWGVDAQHSSNRPHHWIVLSGGTDGLDGNSPAAGAIADEGTISRGESVGLDAAGFLERSDAFNFFNILGDAIVTGATGTNVRDIRVCLLKEISEL